MKTQALKQTESNEDLVTILAALPAIADSLELDNRGSEDIFIRIGEQLQVVFDQATSLENEAAKAIGLISQDSSDDVLSEVNGLTQSCIGALRDWESRITDRLVRVSEVAVDLGRLAPSSIELRKIGKRLSTINIYFAVESSRHNESADAFSAYTTELEKLVKHILDVTSDIEKNSLDAQVKQNRAYESISKGINELKIVAVIAEKAMLDASAQVDEIVKFTTSALDRIGQLSGEVSRQMGNVVIALQFHDIVRQQLEHVIEALRDAQSLAAELGNGSAGASLSHSIIVPEQIGHLYSILSIQTAQIKHVISTIDSAHCTLSRSFINIGHHSDELLASTAGAEKCQAGSSDLTTALSRVAEALDTLGVLLEEVHFLGNQIAEAARIASEATLLLSQRAERIDDINMDVNIQALNAVITSLRLGEKGRTLAILAGEVTSLSNRCDGFLSRIVSNLEQIYNTATDANGGSGALGDMFSTDENILSRLAGVAQRITDACSNYQNHLSVMLQNATRVQEMVDSTGAMLEIIPKMSAELAGYGAQLDVILDGLRTYLPEDFVDDLLVVEVHSNRYTMASERDTHTRALNADETTQRRQEEELTASSVTLFEDGGSDDSWDNVDLF
ncbi:MAG: hypothetical protein NT018_09115 [Armatimonadetes bacterium]|nr:hypothetical protein [Armatimonadota bacterium]